MKTYLIEDTGDSAIIGFKDANITLITPIMKALYDDSDVEMVRYVDKHPELSDRTLYERSRKAMHWMPSRRRRRPSPNITGY